MTDREYVRVNVTSLTSTPRYNEYGEQYAEVDMQLPSNLIESNNIASARMMLTKAKVSMSRIPACTSEISDVVTDPNILNTKYKVMTVPIQGFNSDGTIIYTPDRHADPPYYEYDEHYFKKLSEIKYQYITVTPNQVNAIDPISALNKERSQGFHEFASISDFMYQLSQAVLYNMFDNLRTTFGPSAMDGYYSVSPGILRFVVNSDNTISLITTIFPPDINQRPSSSTLPPPTGDYSPLPYNGSLHVNFRPSHAHGSEYKANIIPTKLGSNYTIAINPDPYLIAVNEDLYNKLHTLPFIKVRNTGIGNWDEPYLYMLDTRQCNLNLTQQLTHWYRGKESIQGSSLSYNFSASDAVSLIDVNSIVFTLDGVNFTSQILPVNISNRVNKSESQLTTLPAITFYFPIWSRPSDSTTDLIIKEDNFTNGGPLTIDPNLLKQRSLRFKLYYITSNGDLHEMFIPKVNTLNLQICFEITRAEETTSMMV